MHGIACMGKSLVEKVSSSTLSKTTPQWLQARVLPSLTGRFAHLRAKVYSASSLCWSMIPPGALVGAIIQAMAQPLLNCRHLGSKCHCCKGVPPPGWRNTGAAIKSVQVSSRVPGWILLAGYYWHSSKRSSPAPLPPPQVGRGYVALVVFVASCG